MVRSIASALVGCLLVSSVASAQVDWPRRPKFPKGERQEILALAKEMGVDAPEKVWFHVVPILGDPYVMIESRVRVEGHLRRWTVALMFRDNWRGPDDAPPPSFRTHRVGRWISMGEVEERSAWRIRDRKWFIDVTLEEGASYEIAEDIVLKVRRGAVEVRLPQPDWLPKQLSKIDAKKIYSIRQIVDTPGNYEVRLAEAHFASWILTLHVENGRVVITGISGEEV